MVITQVDGDKEAHRLRTAVGDGPPVTTALARRRTIGGGAAVVFLQHPLQSIGRAAQGLQAHEGGSPGGIRFGQGLVEAAHLALHQGQLRAQACQHFRLQAGGVLGAGAAALIPAGGDLSRHRHSPRSWPDGS